MLENNCIFSLLGILGEKDSAHNVLLKCLSALYVYQKESSVGE